ncbi:hypothetical protein N1851_002009 [Merluccius polli]|uniref:Uncharacterized protein n=1 Tax=Merluccius polli TaxID=89951 RepID=A0AA47NBS0_MERPO|nr:hypothetical protein N1851_002009 [Merluccius polli]
MVEGKAGLDVREMFRTMVKVRIRVDFNYHKMMGTLEEFTQRNRVRLRVFALRLSSVRGPDVIHLHLERLWQQWRLQCGLYGNPQAWV